MIFTIFEVVPMMIMAVIFGLALSHWLDMFKE